MDNINEYEPYYKVGYIKEITCDFNEKEKPTEIHPINIYENETVHETERSNNPYMDLYDNFGIRGYLGTFPGCCGYGVYYEVGYTKEQIKEATDVLKKILLLNAEGDGFGAIIATVACSEKLKKFQDNGWKLIHEHTNPLSGNQIYTIILE